MVHEIFEVLIKKRNADIGGRITGLAKPVINQANDFPGGRIGNGGF
jgi:hypothetical protein